MEVFKFLAAGIVYVLINLFFIVSALTSYVLSKRPGLSPEVVGALQLLSTLVFLDSSVDLFKAAVNLYFDFTDWKAEQEIKEKKKTEKPHE